MIQTSFKSCTLEMLLEMLTVSDSKLVVDRNNKVDANVTAENKNIIVLLKKAIIAKRAEEKPLK